MGLASSLDRSYRAFVKFESKARWLETSVGPGRLKDGLEGDDKQLQEELDQCRLQGKLALGRLDLREGWKAGGKAGGLERGLER